MINFDDAQPARLRHMKAIRSRGGRACMFCPRVYGRCRRHGDTQTPARQAAGHGRERLGMIEQEFERI